MVRRANALWSLLQGQTVYSFQGRTVSTVAGTGDVAARVIALSRLLGFASCHFVPRNQAAELSEAFVAAGLRTAQWDQYWGRESALTQARAFLRSYDPGSGLRLNTVQPDTPDEVIRAIGEMSVRSGVLPPPGSAMRGHGPKGVILYVTTDDGRIVASGGGFMTYHPDGPRPDEAFWGMLATDPDWRGQRLACWVGAQAIIDMNERFGARGFSSGVKADNPSSQAMCTRLGVVRSEFVYAGATDPTLVGDGPVTR